MLDPAHILVVGPSWVGDMVMAQSLFKLLRQRYPETVMDVLAPPWSQPLLSRMPEVDEAIIIPLGHGELRLRERYRLGRHLRARHYDQAIILPNSFKSALVPFWADIPVRTGYVGEWRWGLINDVRRLDKLALPRTVQRFLALSVAPQADLPLTPLPGLVVTAEAINTALLRLELVHNPQQAVLALCPGAEYGPAKRWPAEYFAEIARAKLAEGWAVWLFGSAKDATLTAEVNALTGECCVDLAGRTSLAEAIDLLSLAEMVVSNDSGLMHVAAALGRKLIALFGSSDPRATPPLHNDAHILSLNLECSPCLQRSCPLGHTHCLLWLKPELVLNKMAEIQRS
jgi:heptosyltransferase-2